jgi:hypothetical protein
VDEPISVVKYEGHTVEVYRARSWGILVSLTNPGEPAHGLVVCGEPEGDADPDGAARDAVGALAEFCSPVVDAMGFEALQSAVVRVLSVLGLSPRSADPPAGPFDFSELAFRAGNAASRFALRGERATPIVPEVTVEPAEAPPTPPEPVPEPESPPPNPMVELFGNIRDLVAALGTRVVPPPPRFRTKLTPVYGEGGRIDHVIREDLPPDSNGP